MKNSNTKKHKGSIFQDSKSGNWIGLLMYKRNRVKRTGKTKKLVEQKLAEYIRDAEKDLNMKVMNVEQLTQRYLDALKLRASERVVDAYRNDIEKRIYPTFRYEDIKKINVEHADDWITSMKNNPEITTNMIRVARKTAIQLFEHARRKRYVETNIFKDSESVKHKKAKLRPLTSAETILMLENAKEDKYGIIWSLLLKTGMRVGESLALTWDDIKFNEKEITINKQYTNGLFKDTTKTESGERKIIISEELNKDLMKHYTDQNLYNIQNNLNSNLVFANEVGNYLNLSNLRDRHFKPLLKKSGISDRIRIHDLRHTFASINLNDNVAPVIISNYLGHSSPRVTMEVYADWINDVGESPSTTLENILKEVDINN